MGAVRYLRGFIPWIAFAAISTVGWQWGALAALVSGVWLLAKDRRSGVAADALILETSTVAYFAAMTAFAFAVPHSPVRTYAGALSLGWLAATAWSTLAVRRPFTLGIARRSTPQEVWQTPQFLRVNMVITTAWATGFALTAAAVAACDAAHTGPLATTVCQVVGFVAPAVFTNRYPKIVQARLGVTR
ncbi:hypothetical protein [Streptomyces silvisoli]|uniref:hypothetical protein n=1 Tax=Streptomyces silvisoli TaxID=3034235 RepID=UPI0028BF51C2|nr:hypothetical protein [Streptomyces silvisoli]